MAEVHKSSESAALAVVDEDPWLSLNASVELSGKVKTTVLIAALDGKVRSQKVGGRRFYHRDDVLSLRTKADDDE